METYHKINSIFKRHMAGPKKGKLIQGDWSRPEFEYLANNVWDFTEKVDGTNIRIGYDLEPTHLNKVEFGGRSDNALIPPPLMEYLQDTFTPEIFRSEGLSNITLFGEGYGPKIQSGGKYREDASFVLFDVLIDGYWLDRENVDDVAAKLGIDSVPTIGYGSLQDAIDIVSTGLTFEKTGGIKRWGRNGLQSQWGEFEAEGIVARPKVPMFNRKGERIVCKIKGKDFK